MLAALRSSWRHESADYCAGGDGLRRDRSDAVLAIERHPVARTTRDAGFSLIETLLVVGVMGIIAGMAIPSTTSMMRVHRLKGDAESVHNLVALAKMRAASQFSRARVFVDMNTNSYSLQRWDKTTSTWVTEGPVTRTSSGVTFGFGTVAAPPPNTQATIGQSPNCTDNVGAAVGNSACVTFSSRGMPVSNVLPPGGGVVGNSALYLTDGSSFYGTTVTTTPLIKFWWAGKANSTWVRQ